MLAEEVADAGFEDRHAARRPSSATVHDAHAAMSRATAGDELPHARVGLRGRHAVDVERVARRIVAAFQLAQLATIDAVSSIGLCAGRRVGIGLLRRPRCEGSDPLVMGVRPHRDPVATPIGP